MLLCRTCALKNSVHVLCRVEVDPSFKLISRSLSVSRHVVLTNATCRCLKLKLHYFALLFTSPTALYNKSTAQATFYRAMLRWARLCHSMSSVRPSVCLSVTFRYRDHIGWNSSKIISRPNSIRPMRGLNPTWAIWCNGNTQKLGWNRGVVSFWAENLQYPRNGAR